MFPTVSTRQKLVFILFWLALIHAVCFVFVFLPYALHGHSDFTIFYTAGKLVSSGQAVHLYDPQAQWTVQQNCCRVPGRDAALLFNHAPFEALFFVPVSLLPYSAAYCVWAGVNTGILLLIGFLLRRYFAALLPHWWLLPFAALAFVPVFIAFVQGQDSLMIALFYTLAFLCLKKNWLFTGGACVAVAAAKPQLVLPFLLVMALGRQWKMLLGAASCGAVLILLPWACLGRTATVGYVEFLLQFSRLPVNASAADPLYMPNLRGLLVAIPGFAAMAPLQGAAIAVASALTIGWAALLRRRSPEEYFSAAVVATLLSSYHLYVHDVSVLLIAFILVACRLFTGPRAGLRGALVMVPWFLLPVVLSLTAHHMFFLYALWTIAFGVSLWRQAGTETGGRIEDKLQASASL